MMIYLNKKDGGAVAIDHATITRLDTRPNGTMVNSNPDGGYHLVTETVEEVLALIDAAQAAAPAPVNPGEPVAT